MDNLMFSLNATLPIFFTMILGWVLRQTGMIDDIFVSKLNKFVFKVALPALLFRDLSQVDFFAVWDTGFVVFCFFTTILSIFIVFLCSFFLKDKRIQGEFIQAGYRSSAAILGIAFIQNLYGTSGMGPLMIVASVPVYNIMAVVILSVMKPQKDRGNKVDVGKTIKGVFTNPIILGIAVGSVWSLLHIPTPDIFSKTVNNLAVLATPLGLMTMGASFQGKQAKETITPALLAAGIKLIFLVMLFLPIAIALGFREQKLIAILVMLGSATTVTCYIMAKNMGHDGTLSSSAVMMTTFFSAFTLTGWLYLLRTFAFI